MLAFYWTFFDLHRHQTIREVLWGMTAFVVACYVATLLDDTFFCGKDVSIQWSQEDGACSVFYAQEPFILNFTLGLTCYLVIYMLPAILLKQGILEASTAVILILAMGTLPIITGIIRFICLKVGTGQENLVCKFSRYCALCDSEPAMTKGFVDILSMVEMTLAIIVASLPGLKVLFSRDLRASSTSSAVTLELNEDLAESCKV